MKTRLSSKLGPPCFHSACFRSARFRSALLYSGILSSLLLSGCVQQGRGLDLFGSFGTNEFGVPYDKMPPPGLCRVWYPNRKPQYQPPIGDCDYLAARLPTGAQLIRGGTPGGNLEGPSPGVHETSLSPTGGYSNGALSNSQGNYPAGYPDSSSAGQNYPDQYGGSANTGAPPPDANGNGPETLEQRRMDDLNRRY